MGAVAACLRDLPVTVNGRALAADLGRGRHIVLARSAVDRDSALVGLVHATAIVSRSHSSGWHMVATARTGRMGMDVETIRGVGLNATPGDAWLGEGERRIVIAAADPVVELACRWVLREAYGKALGVGLALPLDRLAFAGRDGHIRLDAPGIARGWEFALYRRGEILCAIACHPTPAAPLGRKPPGPD